MDFLTDKCKEMLSMRLLDAGTAGNIKVKPMKFLISHYEAEGYGHFVIMKGTALCGLMKMDTVIFTPTLKDAPLFSYDRIKAMGNDTFIIELYDTLLDKSLVKEYDDMAGLKESLKTIPDHDLGTHWYDYMKLSASFAKRGRKCAELFDRGYEDFFNCYLNHLANAPTCDTTQKKQATLEYVNGLFDNGGPSTDAFVKGLGRPAAEKIFKEVIFGVN